MTLPTEPADPAMPDALHLFTDSPEATEALGSALGRALGRGAVLALVGPMGAGKTCFVRGLAAGLDVPEDEVASPTYTLMHAYAGRLPLYHFDAWMSGREGAFLAGGGAEVLEHGADEEGVAVLEWAGDVGEFLPTPRLEIRLQHAGPERRRIELELLGDPSERPSAALEAALGAARSFAGQEIGPSDEPPGPGAVDPDP